MCIRVDVALMGRTILANGGGGNAATYPVLLTRKLEGELGLRDWCFRVSEEPRTPKSLECFFFSLLLTATNIYGVVCYTAMWLLDPLPLVPARQALRHGEL